MGSKAHLAHHVYALADMPLQRYGEYHQKDESTSTMAKGDGADPYGAIIRIRKYEYRIRRGGREEPYFVVDPVGKHRSEPLHDMMQRYVNLDHPELKARYIPHEPAAVAQVLAHHLGVRIVHIELPEPAPAGKEPDPNVVA